MIYSFNFAMFIPNTVLYQGFFPQLLFLFHSNWFNIIKYFKFFCLMMIGVGKCKNKTINKSGFGLNYNEKSIA